MVRYYLSDLESRETLAVGQADDLKISTSTVRVWLSRASIEDGEPYDNKVTIERLVKGSWQVDCIYPAREKGFASM
jgi:hypothetical protein